MTISNAAGRGIPLAILSVMLVAPAGAAPGGPFASAAYKKMVAQNAGLRSFEADIEVHTKLRSFPPVSLTFKGKTYFQAPDKSATRFENVPGALKGMVKDSPSIAPAATWRRHYAVTLVSDDGDVTIFHLVPKSSDDPLASADVTVDDRSGLVQQFSFENKNGSTVTSALQYAPVGPYMLVSSESGAANGRGYKSEVTTTFSNYQINVTIPSSVFDSSQ